MGTRSSVVDVAQDVELVDGEFVDDAGNGDDKLIGAPDVDDGVNDGTDLSRLVSVIGALVQQFLNDVAEVFRE